MPTPEEILKQYWGYDEFRPLQREIIASVLSGRDTLALLPTGGGKSVCYQVPAMVQSGLCLVISPLIALMQDQVRRLSEVGIPAASLHSGMHYKLVKATLEQARQGEYKLLYVSPERLQTYLFNDYLPTLDLNLIAVDEAHCVSQWGHDFRPDYLKIARLRELFTETPILALTATATTHVQADIIKYLSLAKHSEFRQSFARKNVYYHVAYSENKNDHMLRALTESCSIVYCRSRKLTEVTGDYLNLQGIPASVYHAGKSREDRDNAQQEWMNNKTPVMVATTAFGMGIDKSDVRLVLHLDAPENLESWYQEAGRAGRDGQPSVSTTLYNASDLKRLRESTDLHFPPESYLREVYQSVAEYLQIPTGTEPGRYYPFDVFDFSQKFSLHALAAVYALKLLEREGLWTLSEAVYQPSTIQFVCERHVVDGLSDAHPDLAYVAVGLLRMFNAIFYYPVAVRESAIAFRLKIKQPELVQALIRLHKMEVIEYNPTGEGPQMYFHHCRVDSQHLFIDLNRIAVLRRHHDERTKRMIEFLTGNTVCREQYVLRYFGEEAAPSCGHCDVCREQQSRPQSPATIRERLLWQIDETGKALDELVHDRTTAEKEAIIYELRQMMDEGVLVLGAGGVMRMRR